MSIITVETYEAATNQTLSDGQKQQAQFAIDVVSSYVQDQTGIFFGTITGETVRYKADMYGEIIIQEQPVNAVGDITDVLSNTVITYPFYDFISTISCLYAHQVVDIVLDYGYDPVPMSIVGVVVSAVKRGLSSPSGLRAKTVGDVTYEYGDLLDFTQSEREILDAYGHGESTMRLDISNQRHYPNPGIAVVPPDWCS